ncbi:MAG: DNA recombination protein RmuC [Holosporaceae bacterium]|jgi:DNA recombination protein RmuC|nr:DNA recombination protein RmuC [Holosporaceae bacterium]
MTVLMIVSLLSAASIFVILAQYIKLKETVRENDDLRRFKVMHQEMMLEKSILEERCRNLSEKINFLNNSEERWTNIFKSISSDVLSRNNQSFLDLARATFEQLQEKTKADMARNAKSVEELVNPIRNALDGVGNKLGELEKSRVGAYEALKQQVNDLIAMQNLLKIETHHLASSFRSPTTRGRWGELQLRRVVELAGMVNHCDFREQVSVDTGDVRIRPDMVIYLPGGHHIVVDAKVPLSAYLDSVETEDDQRRKILLRDHAKQMRAHISNLAGKKYWQQFDHSPEFVVMFLPGEVFFAAAIEQDPTLLEFALQERVIITSPSLFLALLHTIAQGWRQQNLTENAKQIMKMGHELYGRLAAVAQHLSGLGKSISSTVSAYNHTVASFENRVFVTARRFKKLEMHAGNIPEIQAIEDSIRKPRDRDSDI